MLFKREIKRNFKSFAISCLICSLLVVYIISMSPSFGTDIQQILDLKLPKEMQIAFGMSNLDFNNANGFFAMAFSYIYLFLAIFTASLFSGIVSKEFSDKTAEYLFSLPQKRVKIISTKLIAALIYCFLASLVILLVSILSFSAFIKDSYNLKPIFLMAFAWFIGTLTFGSISFLLSSFFVKTKTTVSVSIGFVLATYMLQVAISMNNKIDFLKYISPFDWFKGSEINNSGELSVKFSIVAIFYIIVSVYLGIQRFKKMDVLV